MLKNNPVAGAGPDDPTIISRVQTKPWHPCQCEFTPPLHAMRTACNQDMRVLVQDIKTSWEC